MSLQDVLVVVSKEGKEKEKFLLSLPNVRKLQGFLKGFWDFNAYADAFPKRNKLSDVDGSIELNGHTLHIEFKESKYGMNRGQVLKAIRQAKFSGIMTVFVFGKTDRPEEVLIFSPDQPEGSGYFECDHAGLFNIFENWAAWTKENSLVTNRTEEWGTAKLYC